MDEREAGLSERSATILGLIAEGRSYDQILQRQPDATYFDIFAAAREALDLLQAAGASQPTAKVTDVAVAGVAVVTAEVTTAEVAYVAAAEGEVLPGRSLPSFIERARATHARAWTRWTPDEDARLTALFNQGESRAEIVRQLGRQPGAIKSRLVKLGLVAEDEEREADTAREVQPRAPGAVSAPDRVAAAPAPPVAPGWEALRARLTPHQDRT